MARDQYEYDVGGKLRDRYGRREMVIVNKHQAPTSTEVQRGYEPCDADGREEIVVPNAMRISSPANPQTLPFHWDPTPNANGSINLAIGSDMPSVVPNDQLDQGNDNIGIGGGYTDPTQGTLGNLGKLTTGISNIGIGGPALTLLTTGSSNVAVGADSLSYLLTGNCNVCLGEASGEIIAAAESNNTLIGHGAGQNATGFNNCTALGFTALSGLTGDNNIAIGTAVFQNMGGAGHDNTAVGSNSQQAATTVNYSTALGANTSATGNGSVAIGADHLGTGASTSTQDAFVLGTTNHAVQVPGTLKVTGNIGFFGHATAARPSAYTLNAGAVSRNLASGAALTNVEQVLREVITDLQGYGLLQ